MVSAGVFFLPSAPATQLGQAQVLFIPYLPARPSHRVVNVYADTRERKRQAHHEVFLFSLAPGSSRVVCQQSISLVAMIVVGDRKQGTATRLLRVARSLVCDSSIPILCSQGTHLDEGSPPKQTTLPHTLSSSSSSSSCSYPPAPVSPCCLVRCDGAESVFRSPRAAPQRHTLARRRRARGARAAARHQS